ncbi:hypothetical protein D3C86_1840400 [compost metagenome]
MARLASAFSMAVDSVISRVRWRASSRWRERAVSTSSSKPGLASCMVERLTATLQSGCPASRQRLIWRQASSMTQLPMGMMSRLFSARGRKRAGEMAPWIGCCQRSSASAPTTWPLRAAYLGW